MADAAFLVENLGRNGLRASAIVLNRAESEPPLCEQRVLQSIVGGIPDVPEQHTEALRRTLETMQEEHRMRGDAAHRAIQGLQEIAPLGTQVIRLPFIHRSEPSAIVLALADAWHESGSDL
jgi:hypothetical protein